ncbi:uro-adherence factor A [Parasteatoda tepidariorum]|uniref:uro-adherence factor A n=1 Tax=Parasteatoda tepidariorum TaxID=114398 RepID=UPI001C71B7E9|nr:uncharacterized protein LOC107449059 [Parasteatoda tepidariorum]XP_015919959.2 uncharacterized protein LOC107449059 [Parasteatoda tepidariorum]
MNRGNPSTLKKSSSIVYDDSSLEDVYLDIDEGDLISEQSSKHSRSSKLQNNESRPSSVTTTEWEEALASMANSESFPASTPASSSGTSPLTGLSSQGVSPSIHNLEQAFPFSIPDDVDQSLSSMSDVLQVEKDFMEYVMSFPLNVSNVPAQLLPEQQPTNSKKHQNDPNPKVGLDHLDNLCKLMEQLSDLKEANIKLKRRVQYLEDIKTLHEIHKEMVGERKVYSSGLSEDDVQQLQESGERTISDESPEDSNHLAAISQEELYKLYRSKTDNHLTADYKGERGHKSRSATANKERRERSKSVGHAGHSKNKKRPSRWSKVKEVLGIEKTDEMSVSASDDPTDRIVDANDKGKSGRKENESVKSYKLTNSKSHSSVLSSRSFSEAERLKASPTVTAKKSGTLDAKTAQAALESFEKEEIAKKSPKSPWGKMKTMIQIRRDHRQPKSESSSSSPRDAKNGKQTILPPESTCGHSPNRRQRSSHRPSYQETATENDFSAHTGQCNGRNHQRLDPGFSEQQHRHRQKSPQKHNYRKSSAPHLESESKVKIEKDLLKNQRENIEILPDNKVTRENGKRKKNKPRPLPLEYSEEITCHSPINDEDREEARRLGMSPSTHRKWMWSRVKDVLKGKREDGEPMSASAPSSPASVEVSNFPFDEEKPESKELNLDSEFRNQRSESESTNPVLLPNSNPSATVTELLRELQQNLSDDFNKKLEEWQRCRDEGIHKSPVLEVERKDSFGRMRKISKPEKKMSTGEKLSKTGHQIPKKDLSWLEKEQQKIEREIIRLTKEKQKFEKRAIRLKQLKEAMTDGQRKEVLVKTSAGEFRFEGISDAFTKKLYEWETKKGVNPELSTIALLDESLKPPVETVITAAGSSSVGSNSTRTSPEPPKNCYQVSRASSEPDLSATQKDSSPNNQTARSKSGDTLLSSGDLEVIATLEADNPITIRQEQKDVIHHTEDGYYSLLEENMYLLDQLKEKEEICGHLQNELDRLDDKTQKNNRNHQEEMEKYRQKLWEIHMSRPRDLQGSLHLISELKSRIEELQNCSDKLKSDRERLEESFRYHSNQQARLADDLIKKMREMQTSGTMVGCNRSGYRRKWRKTMKCDPFSISRIHDLSTKLLQQARDVEQTLMERTRQVCHLRWELLHRDMSAVLLQAALHRVTSQGEPVTILPTWDKRRNRFKNIKAWSVDTTTRRPSEDLVSDDWLQERLKQLSMTPYNDWANIDFSPNDLMTTAHELKRETIGLSLYKPEGISDSEEKKSATCSGDSEMADSDRYYDTGSAVNSRSSSFSSGPGGLRGSHSDTRLYERTRALRRNSSSSMSCVEASDSSSLHDSSDRAHFMIKKFPWRTQWRSLDNVSSSCSSRSSIQDEDISKMHWRSTRSRSRDHDAYQHDDTSYSHLQQKYGSFKEMDEEAEEPKADVSPEWGNQCLITPTAMHLARISDTESEKSRGSPLSHFGRAKQVNMAGGFSKTSRFRPKEFAHPQQYSIKPFQVQEEEPQFPIECHMLTSISAGAEIAYEYGHKNLAYQSNTDGSVESLDKYETAIRDEELTMSDHQQSGLQRIDSDQETRILQTFSGKRNVEDHSSQPIISEVHESYPHHSGISNYREKEQTGCNSLLEESKQSAPGSPNISKIRYKGTKGFGHSPRQPYKEVEDMSFENTKSDKNNESLHNVPREFNL